MIYSLWASFRRSISNAHEPPIAPPTMICLTGSVELVEVTKKAEGVRATNFSNLRSTVWSTSGRC